MQLWTWIMQKWIVCRLPVKSLQSIRKPILKKYILFLNCILLSFSNKRQEYFPAQKGLKASGMQSASSNASYERVQVQQQLHLYVHFYYSINKLVQKHDFSRRESNAPPANTLLSMVRSTHARHNTRCKGVREINPLICCIPYGI